MLRNDAFFFTRLGTFLERADNTARIIDVKYHVLLPREQRVGGALDYYQWQSILRSVSALRGYHWVYHERLQPHRIAEFLILRTEMPRSLVSCYDQVTRHLDLIATPVRGRSGTVRSGRPGADFALGRSGVSDGAGARARRSAEQGYCQVDLPPLNRTCETRINAVLQSHARSRTSTAAG